jgi:hypothetical protein
MEELEGALAEREMVVIASGVVPDAATYHALILAYAYHGDLRACLETLTDMLSVTTTTTTTTTIAPPSPHLSPRRGEEDDERERRGRGRRQTQTQAQQAYGQGAFAASLAAFRAVFLGFARHGVVEQRSTASSSSSSSSSSQNNTHPTSADNPTSSFTSQKYHYYHYHHHHHHHHHHHQQGRRSPFTSHPHSNPNASHGHGYGGENEWTLTTLEALFARFLELPRDTPLRETTLFWLVSAFARTSGRDAAVLRRVFERVEDRFASASALTCHRRDGGGTGGGGGGGRLSRIRERLFSVL